MVCARKRNARGQFVKARKAKKNPPRKKTPKPKRNAKGQFIKARKARRPAKKNPPRPKTPILTRSQREDLDYFASWAHAAYVVLGSPEAAELLKRLKTGRTKDLLSKPLRAKLQRTWKRLYRLQRGEKR